MKLWSLLVGVVAIVTTLKSSRYCVMGNHSSRLDRNFKFRRKVSRRIDGEKKNHATGENRRLDRVFDGEHFNNEIDHVIFDNISSFSKHCLREKKLSTGK